MIQAMSFLDRVTECHVFDPRGHRPFIVDGREVGLIDDALADRLRAFPDVFRVGTGRIEFVPGLDGFESRTEAVDGVLREMKANGEIAGWRNEPYPVGDRFAGPVLFHMERAAVPLFGVRAYGVHMNGAVEKDGRLYMWVGKRSLTKPTGPGKLDQLVAGGQPAGISLMDNLIKECAEEAAIPRALAAKAKPIGAVSYTTRRKEGLRRDVLFNFDLAVPTDFEPRNTDGEIESFRLYPIEEVAEIVCDTDRFKFNCALIVIDFLIRHGVIPPDHPDYLELLKGLHG